MRQIKDFTLRIVAGANIVTVVLMLLVGYSDRVDAAAHPLVGIIGLSFPLFLVADVAFLVFWLCVRKRWAVIPVAGLVLGYGPVTTYCPLSVSRDAPRGALKVLTYNVFTFNGWTPEQEGGEVVRYLARQDADVVCLQEAATQPWQWEQIKGRLGRQYPHVDTSKCKASWGDDIMVLSKFPIVRKERVSYESKTNQSCAFWLLTARGDTTVLVANHLESVGIPAEMKRRFKHMVKGELRGDSAREESRQLYSMLAEATQRRAPQAVAVAEYVRRHRRYPVILCGDFNDSPISYVHRTIARQLTDCYTATGNGPGISYHSNAFYVRIDNIMCSSHFTPYDCHVDRSITASDHYPVVGWVKRIK